jgi:ribonuclease P protein subunit RPR2
MKREDSGSGRRSAKPAWQQEIALERIKILFGLAGRESGKHPARSNRYAGLARRIGMRYNVKIPKEESRRVCKKCCRYLVPGKNCVVRSNSRRQAMEMKCLECGHVTRYPYAKEKGNV